MSRPPLVLVHGAWGGAWIWRRALGPLRAAGHEVHAVTLTGDGERAHLRRADISIFHEFAPPPNGGGHQFLRALVPTNPVAAAANDAILPLIIFTLAFAFALTRLAPEQRAPVQGEGHGGGQ